MSISLENEELLLDNGVQLIARLEAVVFNR
jgi:hypothetical protein